jgi:hypothetical protein
MSRQESKRAVRGQIAVLGVRLAVLALLTVRLATAAETNAPPAARPPKEPSAPPALTVDNSLVGEVVRVNARARFVVLSFPLARMPHLGQRFSVWRTNGIVGELRISGPQRDETIVADLVSGDCRRGDEVRERHMDPPPPAKPAVPEKPRE